MPLEPIARETLDELNRVGTYRRLRRISGAASPRVTIDSRPCVLFAGSNYLDLAHHPEVVEAASRAARDWGTAAGGSRLINGNLEIHEALEAELAAFLGTENALVFGPGYMANIGILPTLLGEQDAIFSDALCHASIIDGARLARAETYIFGHGDLEALQQLLSTHRASHRRALLVADGLYSMDGDVAPLHEMASIAEQWEAMLLVDDTHGTGTLGPGGRGTPAHCGLDPGRIDLFVGSLAKALGSYGAFVAGRGALRELLINTCRSFIFSCALPPPQVEAARAALRVLQGEPWRCEQLAKNAARFRRTLASHGISSAPSTTHIVPVVIGDNDATMEVCEQLLKRGYFAQGIRFPSVPRGSERLRITLMATHTEEEIDGLATALAQLIPPIQERTESR